MNRFRRLIFILAIATATTPALAQFNESGISAGFFDSSNEKDINFSEFHLPPLVVLFENAKTNPQILSLEKARELAEMEVAKQKRHIFSYVTGHASYSFGMADMYGKRIDVEQAVIQKDMAYDQLKQQIATLYIKITNNLVTLKTMGEAAAAYQGAGALDREDFENGNMDIAAYAATKRFESGEVSNYQQMQTTLTTDIITLEILTHTPIITNATTEITLDKSIHKTPKEQAKENKANEKRIKALEKEEKVKTKKLEKAEAKAEKAAAKASKKQKK